MKERWFLIYFLHFCFDLFFSELLAMVMTLFVSELERGWKSKVKLLGHIEMVSLISAEKQTLVIVNSYMCPDVTHTQTQKLLKNYFLKLPNCSCGENLAGFQFSITGVIWPNSDKMKNILKFLPKMLRFKKIKRSFQCLSLLILHFLLPLGTRWDLNIYSYPDYPVIINDKKDFVKVIKHRASELTVPFKNVRNQTFAGYSSFCLYCKFRSFKHSELSQR